MKAMYGLPLDNAELAIWHALHGGGVYTDLYELKNVHDSGVPYIEGREYSDITLIIGRRAAKSCMGHFVNCAELLGGGHKQRLIIEDQYPIFLHISQDIEHAVAGMRQYSLYYLKSSPAGLEILGDLKQSVTMRSIKMAGCGVMKVGAPNIKVGKGDSNACVIMDELAMWQSDEKSAAPDREVEKAVNYGMMQFAPFAKKLKLSTPYTEEGLLWDMHEIGTHGRHLADPEQRAAHSHTLVLQGPSPVLRNPSITKVFLQTEKAKDPVGFEREVGAHFAKSITAYLPADLVRAAVEKGMTQRPPIKGRYYVAAIDPAFKRDAFPLCIGHLEQGGIFVQDLMMSWRGTPDQPLNPGLILPLVGDVLKQYNITTVMSDQHHLESLQSIAEHAGFFIEPFVLTSITKSTIWRNSLTLLYQSKMRLLDHAEQTNELLSLERSITKSKTERIEGKRDDHAVVLAMCVHRALSYGIASPKVEQAENEPTTADGVKAVLAARWGARSRLKPKPLAWWNR